MLATSSTTLAFVDER
jgi:hypothetical protein